MNRNELYNEIDMLWDYQLINLHNDMCLYENIPEDMIKSMGDVLYDLNDTLFRDVIELVDLNHFNFTDDYCFNTSSGLQSLPFDRIREYINIDELTDFVERNEIDLRSYQHEI